MPDRNELLRLAELCEKATGPDRGLDERIGLAMGLRPRMRVGHQCLGTDREVPVRCPSYTATLDAAITLVPKGHAFSLHVDVDGRVFAGVEPDDGDGCSNSHPCGETPALALCAAALRAHATGGSDE